MADVCPDIETLSAAALGEEGQGSDANAHLNACAACRERVEKLEALLAFPRSAEPPPAVLEAVLQGIEREQVAVAVESPAPEPIKVGLTCCYCHGATPRDEAAFCATCLAAHHRDCFAKHGRCAAPGCTETRSVQPQVPVRRPIRRPPRFLVPLLAAASLAGVSVVLVRQYVQKLQRELTEQQMLKPAYVAARDLPAGTVVTEGDIATADFPGAAMERMVGSSRITDKATILGAKTLADIRAGQLFTRNHFPGAFQGAKCGGPAQPRFHPVDPRAQCISRVAWTHTVPGACAPIVGDQGRVFVLGANGRAYCLDRADGREVWGDPGPGPDHRMGFLAGGWLVTVDAAGDLRARDPATGRTAWTLDPDPRGPIVAGPLASPDGEWLYLVGEQSGLVAVDARTGALAWRKEGTAASRAILALDEGGLVLAGFPGRELVALRRDGQFSWRSSLASAPDGLLATERGVLLWAESGDTCLAEWGDRPRVDEHSTLRLPGRIRGLTRVGEHVVASLDTGELVGFRPGERQVRWVQPVSRAGLGPPTDAGEGEVLVADQDGQVFLTSADRSRVWRVQLDRTGAARHAPVRDLEGRAFVVTADAFHALDGQQ